MYLRIISFFLHKVSGLFNSLTIFYISYVNFIAFYMFLKFQKLIKKAEVPKIKYIDNEFKGRSLSFPVGFNFPLKPQTAKE